ncbi:MAG: type III-B CRISPR-associated protein Cas10/Cmr2 [Candidatus Spyradosoma sp.]
MSETSQSSSAVLIFQAGPVQTFIAAARSTRDLWSGSYMLSWLVAAAAKAALETAGACADAVVFPRLDALGVYRTQTRDFSLPLETLLTPAMPNRFAVRVPADRAEAASSAAEKAFRDELKRIADAVWAHLPADDAWKTRWDAQIALFPEITRQTVPENGGYENAFRRCQKLLAARRNTRDFAQFVTDAGQEDAPKDALTGKEEVIGTEDFQKMHFEGEGPYGAISLCKRFWHEAYLQKKFFADRPQDFREAVSYKSVPEIAKKNADASNPYVAVVAMDGDHMGKWMDGKRRLAETKNAALEAHHKEFSKRLARFSNDDAERIVRDHDGRLIYAGGDDVLAMLPATRAFACVAELRKAFNEKIGRDADGAIADVSCGVAVAHKKYPLQRMVREAQRAEHRAKNDYGRGAFAFSLLKRGGEIVHWGAKWDGAARNLFERYCKEMNEGDKSPVSARFPYALAGLLAPYDLEKPVKTAGLGVSALLKAELAVTCERQIEDAATRAEIRELAEKYADALAARPGDFVKLFLTAAFIFRKR